MSTFTHGSLMKRIDLSENQFTGQLSKSLANCSSFEFLALGGNSFEDSFPCWLGTLAKLRVLILRSNRLFGSIQCLAPFSSLRIIDLSDNGFSGELSQVLFETWTAMMRTNVGKSSIMEIEQYIDNDYFFEGPYSMTLTTKGVKIESILMF